MVKRLISYLHVLRAKYIDYKAYLIIVSLIIGVLSAIAAVLLKNLVHVIKWGLQYDWGIDYMKLLYFVYPIIGIALTLLYVRLFHKGALSKGLSHLIYLLTKKEPDIPHQQMYSHLLSSAATVGFGGSVGLEAPIVSTGAAIGANTAKKLRIDSRDRNLLIACGSAAGISAIFNSPIAGIIFAFEVLLPEITIPSFVPLLISSASASVFSNFIYAGKPFFLVTTGWEFKAIPFYILLGILTGLISSYMIKMTYWIEGHFHKSAGKPVRNLLVGGGLLGLLILLFPSLFGEGYDTINALFNGNYSVIYENSIFKDSLSQPWFLLGTVVLIILVKVIATSLTIGAGGNGGIFAPSLFTGAMAGFCFAYFFHLTGIIELNTPNFIAAAMAGVLSGVLSAPLTGIFLIAEITGGYLLFVPLMIVSAIAFFITRYFEPFSVYTKILAETKGWNRNNKDMILLDQISLAELIESDFVTIYEGESIASLKVKTLHSKHNFFPVLDENNYLKGILYFHQLKGFLLQEHNDDMGWDYLVKPVKIKVEINETIDHVLKKLENADTWNLPVTENGIYKGFIFRSRILNMYRQLVKQNRQYF